MDLKLSKPKVTEQSLNELKVGDSVKLNVNNKEKLWVQITEITGSTLKGKIDSLPCEITDVNFGDTLSFAKENIFDILKN